MIFFHLNAVTGICVLPAWEITHYELAAQIYCHCVCYSLSLKPMRVCLTSSSKNTGEDGESHSQLESELECGGEMSRLYQRRVDEVSLHFYSVCM